jgi:hypothetical protein
VPNKVRRTKPIQVKSLKRRVAQTNGSLISARPYSNLIRSTRKANYLHKLGWVWIPGIKQLGNALDIPALREALIGEPWTHTGYNPINYITYTPAAGCGSTIGGAQALCPYSYSNLSTLHFGVSSSNNNPIADIFGVQQAADGYRALIHYRWEDGNAYFDYGTGRVSFTYPTNKGLGVINAGATTFTAYLDSVNYGTSSNNGVKPTDPLYLFGYSFGTSLRPYTGMTVGEALTDVEAKHYGQVWRDCQKTLHPSRVI